LESISIINTLSNPILESKIQRTVEGLKLVVKDKTYDPEGLILSDFQSFDTDNIPDHVGKYASPYVTFRVEKIDNGKKDLLLFLFKNLTNFL
jgi:hypothetical protein